MCRHDKKNDCHHRQSLLPPNSIKIQYGVLENILLTMEEWSGGLASSTNKQKEYDKSIHSNITSSKIENNRILFHDYCLSDGWLRSSYKHLLQNNHTLLANIPYSTTGKQYSSYTLLYQP